MFADSGAPASVPALQTVDIRVAARVLEESLRQVAEYAGEDTASRSISS